MKDDKTSENTSKNTSEDTNGEEIMIKDKEQLITRSKHTDLIFYNTTTTCDSNVNTNTNER